MSGKFDPGYSFRASETFRREPDRWQKNPRRASAAPSPVGDEDERHACALGDFCHAATRSDDGLWHPAGTWQAFCSACRGRIATCLDELPAACVRLLVQIGQRPKTGKAVRVPPGPREPIRLEVDALVREMAFVLGSWHERVAMVARLSPPRGAASLTHPAESVRDAVKVLSAHLDALLALPAEPMVRVFYAPLAAQDAADGRDPSRPWSAPGEDGRVLHSGEAYLLPPLGGEAAGKEILDLHHRARKITGEVRAKPEAFDGIPCRECEQFTLVRAEPPSDPQAPAKHSWCSDPACGAAMDKDDYDEWVTRYQAWARSAIQVCRRCQKAAEKGEPHDCTWEACTCRANGHVLPSGAAA